MIFKTYKLKPLHLISAIILCKIRLDIGACVYIYISDVRPPFYFNGCFSLLFFLIKITFTLQIQN